MAMDKWAQNIFGEWYAPFPSNARCFGSSYPWNNIKSAMQVFNTIFQQFYLMALHQQLQMSSAKKWVFVNYLNSPQNKEFLQFASVLKWEYYEGYRQRLIVLLFMIIYHKLRWTYKIISQQLRTMLFGKWNVHFLYFNTIDYV